MLCFQLEHWQGVPGGSDESAGVHIPSGNHSAERSGHTKIDLDFFDRFQGFLRCLNGGFGSRYIGALHVH